MNRITTFTPVSFFFSKEHIEVLSVKSELVFFRQRDGPWIPTLRLLHKCKYAFSHKVEDNVDFFVIVVLPII